MVTPIWYVIGLTGNTLSAVVWLQRRMHANNSSAVYLVALSISDLLFLLLHLVQVRHRGAAIYIAPRHARPGLFTAAANHLLIACYQIISSPSLFLFSVMEELTDCRTARVLDVFSGDVNFGIVRQINSTLLGVL